uniref:Ubiquitin-like protease family profile domain-containing protein n=2 Tax=Lygus hesperus TaxID=30085 RepID=A0A0K8T5L9_LYGHE
MTFLQQIYSGLRWIFSPKTTTTQNADETSLIGNKRRRSNGDENDVILVDDSPPKKQRVNQEDWVLADNIPRNKFSSSATQTSDFVIPRKTDRVRGSISSKPVVNSWFVIDDNDSSRSPSKFKNLYKAPKHVRSPEKNHRAALSISSVSPIRNMSMMSIDLTASSENDQPKAMRKNSKTMGNSQFLSGFSWSSPANGEMSHGAYERLLGSVISMSAKETMKSPENVKPQKHISIIDLTDDDDGTTEISTVDLTQQGLRRLHKFNELSRTSKTPLVTPNVINVEEDNETPPRRIVDRVNSFQEKLDTNMYTKPDLISKGFLDHNKSMEQFLKFKSQYEQKARCESEASLSTLHEIIEKRLQTHLKITESILVEEEEEEITTEKPVLTPQMLSKVQNAQNPTLNPNQVLVSKFKLDIRRADFMTLKNLNWLNDAIINFYMELIVERSGSEKKYPSVYVFSTFFFPGLKNGYERVRRYTKKVDLFSKELILVPIHLSVHWCMAKIDMNIRRSSTMIQC